MVNMLGIKRNLMEDRAQSYFESKPTSTNLYQSLESKMKSVILVSKIFPYFEVIDYSFKF